MHASVKGATEEYAVDFWFELVLGNPYGIAALAVLALFVAKASWFAWRLYTRSRDA